MAIVHKVQTSICDLAKQLAFLECNLLVAVAASEIKKRKSDVTFALRYTTSFKTIVSNAENMTKCAQNRTCARPTWLELLLCQILQACWWGRAVTGAAELGVVHNHGLPVQFAAQFEREVAELGVVHCATEQAGSCDTRRVVWQPRFHFRTEAGVSSRLS